MCRFRSCTHLWAFPCNVFVTAQCACLRKPSEIWAVFDLMYEVFTSPLSATISALKQGIQLIALTHWLQSCWVVIKAVQWTYCPGENAQRRVTWYHTQKEGSLYCRERGRKRGHSDLLSSTLLSCPVSPASRGEDGILSKFSTSVGGRDQTSRFPSCRPRDPRGPAGFWGFPGVLPVCGGEPWEVATQWHRHGHH